MEIAVANAVYKDNISYSAKITYGNREITSLDKERIKFISFYADMYIRVEDEKRGFEYEIEFQTVYDNSMAIRIFRYGFERAVRLADFKNMGDTITEKANVLKYWKYDLDRFYPIATIRNTPSSLCESDSHQIKDLGSLLFYRWGIADATLPIIFLHYVKFLLSCLYV